MIRVVAVWMAYLQRGIVSQASAEVDGAKRVVTIFTGTPWRS
jgi:hypothetical protein